MNITKEMEILEDDMNILKKRKTKKQSRDLLELYLTKFPVRREDESEPDAKEDQMTIKCCLCGKEIGYYEYPECGRPLVDGVVCVQCKIKCRNYEDAVKASYPNSLRYWPYPSDIEEK